MKINAALASLAIFSSRLRINIYCSVTLLPAPRANTFPIVWRQVPLQHVDIKAVRVSINSQLPPKRVGIRFSIQNVCVCVTDSVANLGDFRLKLGYF